MRRTTALDRALVSLIAVAIVLSVVTIVLFVAYLLYGTLVVRFGGADLPYRFLSMDHDPVFNTLATVAGLIVTIACGALAMFVLVSNTDDTDASIVLFFSLVGMGFAAGVVRLSMDVTLRFFGHFVP